MRIDRRAGNGWLVSGLLACLALAPAACAEDLTTLAGVTYREVHVLRVDPDGIIWEHSTGVCKVDFTDSPESVRRKYRYDAAKAAAYQTAQAQTRRLAAERQQQGEQLAEAWRATQLRRMAAAMKSEEPPGTLVYRRDAFGVAAERSVGEQIAEKKSAQELLTKDDGTIWDRRLWTIPCLIAGGGYQPGGAFDARVEHNAQEFQKSLHATGDDFFNPIYLTKSYNQDVDRAEAFARGRP